ncbi:MAG: hypothetical protein HC803_07180 [Saprospiraceae bacterium]|nr:hypothetical protein [Saprospiraceae bacterium]
MKNLWIILLVSVMILGMVTFPKSKTALFEVIENQVFQGNESLESYNDMIFKGIKKQVKFFPKYQYYLEHTDSVRQIVTAALENENTDLEIVISKLAQQIDDKKSRKQLLRRFQLLVDLQLIEKKTLNIALKHSELRVNELVLLNYFAYKIGKPCIEYPISEFLMLNTKNYVCKGEMVNWKYIVSSIYRCDKSDFRIWLNDKPLVLDKENSYKSSFKLRPTKIGKNTFEITIEGRNKEGNRERTTREFQFWVEK